MTPTTMDHAFTELHSLVHQRLGIDPDILAAASAAEVGTALGGTVDQNFSLPIHAGSGSTSDSKATYGVTITGWFAIESPAQGTWHIVAKVDGTVVVDKNGVKKGDQIPFTAKTSFWSKTTIAITATWSQQADTTLVVHLHATY